MLVVRGHSSRHMYSCNHLHSLSLPHYPSKFTVTETFHYSKCQCRSSLQCKHIWVPWLRCTLFAASHKKKNWLKLNILVSWLVLVNIVPNILTGLSLHNWWILFLNCQILSIFFDSESLCGHASPSQFHHRYSLNWLVSSLKRINPDNWHSLTQAQRKHSQVMSRRCQNIHSSQSIQWEISLTTSCCTV